MVWSQIRHRLENDFLAPSLRGHIRYFVCCYSKCPDQEGRAAILLDGREVIEGSYWEQWSKAHLLPKDDKLEKRLHTEFPYMDDTAVKYGQFDQRQLYIAYREFSEQSIEKSLASDNMLVRIMALLDRRTGKRTLERLGKSIADEPEMFRLFYDIRCKAEKMAPQS